MQNPFIENRTADFTIFESQMHAFPPHVHSHIEIIYGLAGVTTIGANSELYALCKGDCAIIFPGTVHSYQEAGNDNLIRILLCALPLAGEFQHLMLRRHPKSPLVSRSFLHPQARHALDSLWNEKDTASIKQQTALLQLFLAYLFPELQLVKNQLTGTHTLAQTAISFLMTEFQNPITLESAANTLGISKYQLSRLFTSQFHTSFTRYIQQLRVEKAKELLAATSGSVLDISLECGFDNPRNFNRVFSRLAGCTPSEYRKSQLSLQSPNTIS